MLAATMLTAVGACLAGVGTLGALLGCWQLLGWLLTGGAPILADVWRHSGLTGDLFVAFFAWLPAILALGIVFHLLVAWLGIGLVRRRAWARRGGLLLAAVWVAGAAIVWLVVRRALEDLAAGYPDRAGFAHAAEFLAGEVAVLGAALGAGFALLLLQPAVRAQFRTGS
jgi:hypothetical protein